MYSASVASLPRPIGRDDLSPDIVAVVCWRAIKPYLWNLVRAWERTIMFRSSLRLIAGMAVAVGNAGWPCRKYGTVGTLEAADSFATSLSLTFTGFQDLRVCANCHR